MAKHQDLVVPRSAATPPAVVRTGQRVAVEGDSGWHAYVGAGKNMLRVVDDRAYPSHRDALAACRKNRPGKD